MAPRDASRVQLDFPQLVADLIADLSLTGTVGLLEFSDQVVPAFLIGSRGIVFGVENPVFTSAGTFFASVESPPASTVIVDTGAQAAGDYDIRAQIDQTGSIAVVATATVLEHRDAANAATLATLLAIGSRNAQDGRSALLPLIGYTLGLNERLRVVSPSSVFNGQIAGNIMINLRPTP